MSIIQIIAENLQKGVFCIFKGGALFLEFRDHDTRGQRSKKLKGR